MARVSRDQGASELGFPRLLRPGEMQSEAGRAERVIRPTGRAKTRRLLLSWWLRSVFFPDQSAPSSGRGYAPSLGPRSQAPLAAKRPDGMWFSPTRT